MNKLWYILKENNQFGPFDETELQRMFQDNRISADTTLIRKGIKRKILLQELIKKKPSIKLKTRTFVNPFREFPYRFKNENVIIPQKNKKGSLQARKLGKTKGGWIGQLKKELAEYSFLLKNKKYLIGIALIFFGFIGTISLVSHYHQVNQFDIERPHDADRGDFKQFEENLKSAYKKRKVTWNILNSKDMKTMWLGTSLPGEVEVELIFSSKDQKILSKTPVKFTSRFFLKNFMTSINSIRFQEGSRITPGFYHVRLNVIRRNLTFWEKIFTPNFDPKEIYSTEMLVGAQSKKNFLRELKKFHQLLEKKENAFLQDITMKYQTLITISERISSYLLRAKNYKSKRQITFMKNDFLKGYQNKYGAFFSNFMVENEAKFKELTAKANNLNSSMIAHYSFLSSVAKNLGIISVDALDGFQQLPNSRAVFDSVLERYHAIIEQCKKKLNSIEN